MRFALMGRVLGYEGRGVQTFLNGLLAGISKIQCDHEFVLFTDPDQKSLNLHQGWRFTQTTLPPRTKHLVGKFYWDHISIGHACKSMGIDALFAPAHVRPLYVPCASVVAVLDMMYHLFPHEWSWFDQSYFRVAVSTLTTRADRIMAISENTRKDILKLLRIPEGKVKVVYPGVPEGFLLLNESDSLLIREKYQLFDPFILYVGSFHPRKNLQVLVDAYEIIASDLPHELVILGPPTWSNPSLEKRLRECKCGERIRRIGYVPREELPIFYNQAELFVFPSLYEGFGFPILEAMACGCPVIACNNSSIPELTGDAALLIEPGNTIDLSSAIQLVLGDAKLRKSMEHRAIEQAKRFTWVQAAEKTITLLEEAASSWHGQ